MTFCLGVKTADGLVALSDRRITSGSEVSSSKKVSIHQVQNHSMFIMTAGLRSVRDKAITYFEEVLENEDSGFDKLYQAVNSFGNKCAYNRQVEMEKACRLSSSPIHSPYSQIEKRTTGLVCT